jgi:hypothetical protein
MIVSTLVLATLAIDPAAAWSIPSLNGAGVRPAWAGDVDGDGHADLVTVSPSDPEHAGIVGVYLGGPAGLPMAPDWEQDLTGDAEYLLAQGVGDVDGDGYDDVIATKPTAAVSVAFEGTAQLYRGSANGLEDTASWTASGGMGATGIVFLGFGAGIAGDADFDADGYADFAVLAPGYVDLSGNGGRVFVFFGSDTGPSTMAQLELTPTALALPDGVTAMFDRIAVVPDLDGDGDDELAVTAGVGWPVRMIVTVWMPEDGALPPEPTITIDTSTALTIPVDVLGKTPGAFNVPLESGDFDGDGDDELVVTISDALRRVLGYHADEPRTPAWTVWDPTVSLGEGVAWWTTFGTSLAAGDVDGDGIDELVVGAPRAEGVAAPYLLLFAGTSDGLDAGPRAVVQAPSAQVLYGIAATFLGDVDGDGFGEIAVDSNPQGAPGEVLVYPGEPLADACASDTDLDSICDAIDVCVDVFDPAQEDIDADGVGDVCEDGGETGSDESDATTNDASTSESESESGSDTSASTTGHESTSTGGGTTSGSEGSGSDDDAGHQVAETGCACTSGHGSPRALLGLALLLAFRRRRLAAAVALACGACEEPVRSLSSGSSEGSTSSADSTTTTETTDSVGSTSGIDPLLCCSEDGSAVLSCDDGTVIAACEDTERCGPAMECEDACAVARDVRDSIGCEYFAVPMSMPAEAGDICFAALVSNAWRTPAHVRVAHDGADVDLSQALVTLVDYDLVPLDPAHGLPPGTTAAILLTGPGCAQLWTADASPVAAAVDDAMHVETGIHRAFAIRSDVPVVVHQVMPFLGAQSHVTGGSLLLPTHTWDDNYAVFGPAPTLVVPASVEGEYVPTLSIVARDDDTRVTILPGPEIEGGGGVPSSPAGEPFELMLHAGEHAQIVQSAELDGTVLEADRPVGVWIGHQCAYVPEGIAACDHLEQMLPGVSALGSRYVGAGVRRSNEPALWYLFGAVDGTALSWSTDVGGPSTLARGEAAFVHAGEAFVVESQDADHPFYLFNYMTGMDALGVQAPVDGGDPDFVVSVPPEQFLRRYVFAIDPTYVPQLVVVRSAEDAAPVVLTCGESGATAEVHDWHDVAGGYQYARVGLSDAYAPCLGNNQAASASPFGLWVWGLAAWTSVGYPAGMGLADINDVRLPPVP